MIVKTGIPGLDEKMGDVRNGSTIGIFYEHAPSLDLATHLVAENLSYGNGVVLVAIDHHPLSLLTRIDTLVDVEEMLRKKRLLLINCHYFVMGLTDSLISVFDRFGVATREIIEGKGYDLTDLSQWQKFREELIGRALSFYLQGNMVIVYDGMSTYLDKIKNFLEPVAALSGMKFTAERVAREGKINHVGVGLWLKDVLPKDVETRCFQIPDYLIEIVPSPQREVWIARMLRPMPLEVEVRWEA